MREGLRHSRLCRFFLKNFIKTFVPFRQPATFLKLLSFLLQEWVYTHGQQIRQQQHCLSLSTTFPASQVLLLPCNMADGKQVCTRTDSHTCT